MERTPEMTNRIKLERLKRGWTQEQLAQLSGLSVRTIQRLETSASAALDSLAALAAVFELEVEALRPKSDRIHFSAPWSRNLVLTTACVIPALLGAELLFSGMLWITPVLFLALYLLFAVRGYSVKEGRLLIHWTGRSRSYPLSELQQIEVLPEAMMGSYRVFGIGGVFSYVGHFKNGVLGRYLAYATSPANALVLKFNKTTVVITPDSPEQMKSSLESAIHRLDD